MNVNPHPHPHPPTPPPPPPSDAARGGRPHRRPGGAAAHRPRQRGGVRRPKHHELRRPFQKGERARAGSACVFIFVCVSVSCVCVCLLCVFILLGFGGWETRSTPALLRPPCAPTLPLSTSPPPAPPAPQPPAYTHPPTECLGNGQTLRPNPEGMVVRPHHKASTSLLPNTPPHLHLSTPPPLRPPLRSAARTSPPTWPSCPRPES